jgi:hypothetical protein
MPAGHDKAAEHGSEDHDIADDYKHARISLFLIDVQRMRGTMSLTGMFRISAQPERT